IMAHPDDMEDAFGGTLLKLITEQCIDPTNIFLVTCTDGGKGGRSMYQDAEILKHLRVEEQYKALEYLHIPHANYYNVMQPDGFINAETLLEQVVYYIRTLQPDIVCTHSPDTYFSLNDTGEVYYNHKDHRTIGQVTLDAVYPYS